MWRRLVWLVVVASCGSPPPPAPSVVITATPSAVCFGDDFQTEIVLDAAKSARHLSLVPAPPDPNAPPLKIKWSFAGSQIRIEGDPTRDHTADEQITVRMAGDRPLHVKLRVENDEHGVTEAVTTIAVTPLDDSGQCPLAAP
jgi:hypothetical protein